MLGLLTAFFAEFSRLKLFLIVFTASLVAILLSFKIGGFAATAVVFVPAIISILQITKGVWSPEGGSKSAIGLASLGVALVAITSNKVWRPFLDALLEPLSSRYSVFKELPADTPSTIGLVFLAFVILVVNYYSRDTTAMKQHSASIDKEFPERHYKQLLNSFCGILLDDLRNIDRETNWSAEMFVPLDAEVDAQRGLKKSRKLTDLLTAIKADRTTRAFLVLGDPGSGKSVALRKLCRGLLEEVPKTGKVPLYINLKEWTTNQRWTEANPPTVNDLHEFVISNLKSRGDVFTSDFIDKYFNKMFENGRLFFVFDSFDEIPAVLDEAEHSWLIGELSGIIYRYLSGAHESRGVLASRIFRRPTARFDAKSILEIRPFSEKKIVRMLKQSLSFDEKLATDLFTKRRDLVPVARNPFSAALISNYAREHNNTLPGTQAELYASYVMRRLSACEDRIQSKGLTQEQVIHTSTEIAYLMFRSEHLGLEAGVDHLVTNLSGLPVAEVVDILAFSRLGRLGSGPQRRFSFVHRRFNEYFVVQKFIQIPSLVPAEAVPKDSRWRDALVLYCEVAGKEEARRIAAFCWEEIQKLANLKERSGTDHISAVHCLRFLRDAFRSRLDCIDEFREGLRDYIMAEIESSPSLLSKKLAVEAVGLLHDRDIEIAIHAALMTDNLWISETAMKSCYYLPRLSEELSDSLVLYVDRIDTFQFVKQYSDLSFSFKLSNAFSRLKKFCTLRLFDCIGLALLFCLLCLAEPVLGGLMLLYFYLQPSVFSGPQVTDTFSVVTWRLSIPLTIIYGNFVMYWSNSLLGVAQVKVPAMGLSIPYGLWIGLSLAVPWYQIITYRRWFFSGEPTSPGRVGQFFVWLSRYITFRRVVGSILVLLSTILLIWGLYLIIDAAERLPSVAQAALIILFAGIVIASRAIEPLLEYYWRLKDYKSTAAFFGRVHSDRVSIGNHFLALKTTEGRTNFVLELDRRKIQPTGNWSNGVLPNINNDRASSFLAQLEEKWLGLTR